MVIRGRRRLARRLKLLREDSLKNGATSTQITRLLKKLKRAAKAGCSWPGGYYVYFSKPVNPVADNAPGYFDIVRHPYDFKTLQDEATSIASSRTTALHRSIVENCERIFSNCLRYNRTGESSEE